MSGGQWFDTADVDLVRQYLAECNVEWEIALMMSMLAGRERTTDELWEEMILGWAHGYARRWTN